MTCLKNLFDQDEDTYIFFLSQQNNGVGKTY